MRLSLGISLCQDTWCPLALLISSTELLYSSLRRSSPHEWIASSGTSPRYSREWGLKWTLVRPVWPVTMLAAWSPERPWPLISSNLLYQDLCLSALGRWKMMGRGSGKAENRPVCCRIVNYQGMKWALAHIFSTPLGCTWFWEIHEGFCKQLRNGLLLSHLPAFLSATTSVWLNTNQGESKHLTPGTWQTSLGTPILRKLGSTWVSCLEGHTLCKAEGDISSVHMWGFLIFIFQKGSISMPWGNP